VVLDKLSGGIERDLQTNGENLVKLKNENFKKMKKTMGIRTGLTNNRRKLNSNRKQSLETTSNNVSPTNLTQTRTNGELN